MTDNQKKANDVLIKALNKVADRNNISIRLVKINISLEKSRMLKLDILPGGHAPYVAQLKDLIPVLFVVGGAASKLIKLVEEQAAEIGQTDLSKVYIQVFTPDTQTAHLSLYNNGEKLKTKLITEVVN